MANFGAVIYSPTFSGVWLQPNSAPKPSTPKVHSCSTNIATRYIKGIRESFPTLAWLDTKMISLENRQNSTLEQEEKPSVNEDRQVHHVLTCHRLLSVQMLESQLQLHGSSQMVPPTLTVKDVSPSWFSLHRTVHQRLHGCENARKS